MTADVRHYYQDPSIATTYDRERFASLAGRTFDRLEKQALNGLIRRVRQEIPNPAVLDIPCGTGRITEFLLGQGLVVTGGDISRAMIDVARAKCACYGPQVMWQELDLDCIALPDGSVDLATCIRLFHHLDSEARVGILRELARITRRFVIVNVSLSSRIYRWRRRVKRALGQGVSQTSVTWANLSRETSAAGLRIEARRLVWPLLSEDLVLLLRKG